MFKKILVPLGGSVLSEKALPLVRELQDAGAEAITLLAVAEPARATVQRRRAVRRPVPLAAVTGAYPRTVIRTMPPVYVEPRDQAIDRREQELLDYGSVTAEVIRTGVAPLLVVRPNKRAARPNR